MMSSSFFSAVNITLMLCENKELYNSSYRKQQVQPSQGDQLKPTRSLHLGGGGGEPGGGGGIVLAAG
jgi:CRISPR/Cas system CSM-associated protein Csm5 (group 7 of RAMP superfamily)